ncbi:tRNA lysidine(34) synthetase TilS [Bacillus sp. CGMCC 1.16607]|uniref:tRNA lysidine(34) synthetase TilS n=1 Tax=Bacillus sp. CGMCC 1.16607 TaxID=3351842 RepID=UPI00362AA16D
MLEQKVEAFINRHSLSFFGKRMIVGVSGGPDSLSLLHYLWRRQKQWNISIIAAHVDHMFRGRQSYLEAIYVKEYCKELNIPFEWVQINVEDYIKSAHLSTQVGARECRYKFFAEMMSKYRASYLVLGHHGDDQVETMLMRMTRGSSGKARAGIPIKRPFGDGEIIRPFLAVNKGDIEEYCLKYDLNPRRDPSNSKPTYSRNRFRLKVVPFLKTENPIVDAHFQRMSEELYQDEIYLEELTFEKMNTVIESRNDNEITISIEKFLEMPMPLQRRGIQLILNYLYKVRPSSLSALHIDLIFSLLTNQSPSGKLDFPEGLQIIRSYQKCHFLFERMVIQPYCFELEVPSQMILPNGGMVTLEYVKEKNDHQGQNQLLLNTQKTVFPIIVRTRKNGDRIQPKGMSGTKKIKDIFIDQKVPQSERAGWPIFTDGRGTILWIPELKKSYDEASDEVLDSYLLITYKKKH